jgi:hypothetical protein
MRKLTRKPKPGEQSPDSAPEESRTKTGRLRAASSADRGSSRAWPYVFWTVVSLLVLALVINYDRRSAADGLTHLAEGKRLESKGDSYDAMAEYRLALRNTRLSNNLRAEAAVLLAELEIRERGNTKAAMELLQEARRLSFRASDRLGVPARIRALQETPLKGARRSVSAAASSSEYGSGLLVIPPAEETSGPILASLPSGRSVHVGQFAGRLNRLGLLHSPQFRGAPDQLEQQLVEFIREEEAIDRAIARREHLDPHIQEQLWQIYRSMVRAKGADEVTPALTSEETSAAVAALYKERQSQFVRPATVSVAAIFTASRPDAEAVRLELQSGHSFDAVATSRSLDKVTGAKGGFLGQFGEQDTEVPFLGKQPGLASKFHSLPSGSITSPAQFGDKWAIFQIRSKVPAVATTFEEVQPRLLIEVLRRANDEKKRPKKLDELTAKTDLKLLGQFWDVIDGVSTGTKTALTPGDRETK